MSGNLGSRRWIGDYVAPVHPEGHKLLLIAAAGSLVGFLMWSPIGWLLAFATVAIAVFFRDPERVSPLREGLVLAPADGRVIGIETCMPPVELGLSGGERTRIAIHLSLIDVHVNRAPVAGRVLRSVYVPGAFLNATLDKASENNERRGIVVATPSGEEIAVIQIAGVIARRIVTFVGEADSVGAGQRIGLIRFGSRVDVYLPPGRNALVAPDQRMVAGETVIADLASGEAEREARRS